MSKIILILFSTLTLLSFYSSYSGLGLEEIKQEKTKSSRLGSRSYGSSYSGGWSYGK